ncbi:MAG: presenilin family intramembrane aspartyl protease PSH [Methanobacteriota archaeon]
MPAGSKEFRTVATMGAVMVATQLLALVVATPFKDAGFQAFEDPSDPMNPLLYLVAIILFSALILAIVKLGKKNIIKAIILFATWAVILDVFLIVFANALYYGLSVDSWLWEISLALAAVVASAITYVLVVNPEWYVVNAVGILVGAGVASILGISLWILPMLILLVALAIYDAISVYKTKHMISLADAVTEQHLPVLMVFPKDEGYSFKEQKGIKEEIDQGKEREAMFIGLGDIVIPGALVVSAFINLPPEYIGEMFKPLLVAAGTMVGIVAGFSVLMRYVLKGNPQAGLPLLNGGAIIGYAFSYVLLYQNLTFGISLG